jgi:CheY-like chemotaxis protein
MSTDERPLRILIADDTPANLQLASRVFSQRGHLVQTVADGCEALAEFQSHPPDIVLMDVHMPRMDGPSAALAIRASAGERAALVPIVGISAFTDLGDRRHYMLSGMDGFLSRPVELPQLVEVVEGLGRSLLPRSDGSNDNAPATYASGYAPPPVDGPLALLRCGGDCELFRQLAAAFEQRAHSLVTEFRDAIVAQQTAPARSAIQALARLAATSAASQLLKKCLSLDAEAAANGLRGLAKKSSGLAKDIEIAARELGHFSASLSSDSVSLTEA